MVTHPMAHRRAAVSVISTLALAAGLLTAAPAFAGSECQVKNIDTGVTEPSLQRAVRAATAGNHLRVTGTCPGTTTIGKSLTIRGVTTAATGTPILGGFRGSDPRFWVVKVASGSAVVIRDLTIRGGRNASGIQNHGTVTLRDVIIRDNGFQAGGGVWNDGTLVLNGTTLIKRNTSAWGAGVIVGEGATVVMNHSSSIRANTALDTGGGVMVSQGATLVMNDLSVIAQNAAQNGAHAGGGGVDIGQGGTLEMRDASAIRNNTAAVGPGGGLKDHHATLIGVVCGPGDTANVRDNLPDDCSTADDR